MESEDSKGLLRRNAGPGRDTSRALLSGRIGPGGRTFHCRVATITRKNGAAAKAIAGLDYDARQGKHSKRANELEYEGGRPREEMAAALITAEAANGRKNGKIALDLEIELPIESTPDQRREIARHIAQHFELYGCPSHWAIHSHNSAKEFQPHLHMTTTARPVDQTRAGQWIGSAPGWKGHPGVPTVIPGPAAMKYFRREVVAAAIRDATGLEWHGGRLWETGIDRPAKVRLPMGVYKRIGASEDRGMPADSNSAIDDGDYGKVLKARREWVEMRKREAAERKAAKEEAKRTAAHQKLARLGIALIDQKEANRQADIARQQGLETGLQWNQPKPVTPLNETQTKYVKDVHRRLDLELPDLTTAEGLGQAWAAVRATEKAEAAAKPVQHVDDTRTQKLEKENQELREALQVAQSPPVGPPKSSQGGGGFAAQQHPARKPSQATPAAPQPSQPTVEALKMDPGTFEHERKAKTKAMPEALLIATYQATFAAYKEADAAARTAAGQNAGNAKADRLLLRTGLNALQAELKARSLPVPSPSPQPRNGVQR